MLTISKISFHGNLAMLFLRLVNSEAHAGACCRGSYSFMRTKERGRAQRHTILFKGTTPFTYLLPLGPASQQHHTLAIKPLAHGP